MTRPPISIEANTVRLGPRLSVRFERTLRVPDDNKVYPLPPGLGAFPVFRVQDYALALPASWRERGGIFIPMYQREALWLGFHGARWKPNALRITMGGVNAISGEINREELSATPQNYIVCPNQPWLDGINAGAGAVRQFVAMPLGLGATVEAAVTGAETTGGFQITVHEPKAGVFPDEPPAEMKGPASGRPALATAPMGLGAGGWLKQNIYPDPYGIDTWERTPGTVLLVHLLNSAQFHEVTGRHAPPPPISPETYAAHGLPWFELYDETQGDLSSASKLRDAKTVAQRETELGHQPDEPRIDPRSLPVVTISNQPPARPRDSEQKHSAEHE